MIYSNGFPATYQPISYPYQSYQQMTPPTIRAEIVQVDSEEAASAYPVGVGSSQMMIAKDDSAIYVKTALANGQSNLDVFIKRPKTPSKPPFDPDRYVTRDELEKRLEAILGGNTAIVERETTEDEK